VTDCHDALPIFRAAFTPNGRRVVLEQNGSAIPGTDRYRLDDDGHTAHPVRDDFDGYAYRDHRAVCPYQLDR
jgi:hypothetical protein